jgi:hypothetical protein
MIFRRNRKGSGASGGQHVMRGRDGPGNGQRSDAGSDRNPLARRFRSDDEPDTIDLMETGNPPAPGGGHGETSMTRDLSGGAAPDGGLTPDIGFSLISYVPATGKFYAQPGPDGSPGRLGDVPIDAPTELRHGDVIEIGGSRLLFRPSVKPDGSD